jgi:hypothetical protein
MKTDAAAGHRTLRVRASTFERRFSSAPCARAEKDRASNRNHGSSCIELIRPWTLTVFGSKSACGNVRKYKTAGLMQEILPDPQTIISSKSARGQYEANQRSGLLRCIIGGSNARRSRQEERSSNASSGIDTKSGRSGIRLCSSILS